MNHLPQKLAREDIFSRNEYPFRQTRTERLRKFTMIELLIVIAIIAILAAMLLPALNKARNQASGIKCRGNLKQVGLMMIQYGTDYRGWVPGGSIIYTKNAPGRTDHLAWPHFLQSVGYISGDPVHPPKNSPLKCPVIPQGTTIPWCSYNLNCNLGAGTALGTAEGKKNYRYEGYASVNTSSEPFWSFFVHDSLRQASKVAYVGDSTDYSGSNNTIFPHNMAANMVFVDGHVEAVRFYDVKTSAAHKFPPAPPTYIYYYSHQTIDSWPFRSI